jgi:hypothetical protein
MAAHPPPHTSLYASLFQAEVNGLSGFRTVKDRAESEKCLSILAALRAALGNLSPEGSAQTSLESLFASLVADQVKAAYSKEAIYKFVTEIIREECPWDENLETKPNLSFEDEGKIQRVTPCPPESAPQQE